MLESGNNRGPSSDIKYHLVHQYTALETSLQSNIMIGLEFPIKDLRYCFFLFNLYVIYC